MMEKGQRVLKREQAMRSKRHAWDSWWQDIAEHVMPRKAFITDQAYDVPDESDVNRLYDTTALTANQTLARGMHTHITPASRTFAEIQPPEGGEYSYAVKSWFYKATVKLRAALTKSNFHNQVGEYYLEHSGFGTAAMFCEWNARLGKLVFKNFRVGSYSIEENNETGAVDSIAFTYELLPRQIIQKYGEDNVPALVRERAADETLQNVTMEIVHLIEPRADYDPERIDAGNMPWASVHVLRESQDVLLESGYFEFPVAVARWLKWGKSPWGWSPSNFALPIINQLNFLEQCTDVAVERAAFPAWLIPSTFKGEFDPRPHGRSVYDASAGGDAMKPEELVSRGQIGHAYEREEQKRNVIREHFHEGLFLTISRRDKVMTAREISRIEAEQAADFHPFFAQLTSEFLEPIIKRAFAEMLRNGQFGEPPAELFRQVGGQWEMDDPNIEFSSRLGLAFEQAEALGLLDTIDELAPAAQIVGASVYDWCDFTKAGPMLARARGVSPEVFKSAEEIAAIQEGRAQAEQAAAAAQQAQQLAGAVGSLGGADEAEKLLGQ